MASLLVSKYGYELDPWQERILTAWLQRKPDDSLLATSCGVAVPRQNGKNAILEARELYGIVATGEKFLHTAHEVKTARKAFLRLAGFFENPREYPELAEMVGTIRRTNGQEAIVLTNGGSVEFSARSRGAARGFTVDTVVFDEAQELTDEQLEAMLPTLSAAPSGTRQFIYTGTPPGPNSPGEVFRRTRETALAGRDTRLAWHEWSVEELPSNKATFEDIKEACYTTNPAIGYRIDINFCEREFNAMAIDGFARERLGWWTSTTASAALPKIIWEKTKTDNPPTQGRKTFGVKFSPDGSQVALVACRCPENGAAYCELLGVRTLADGVKWLIDFFVESQTQKTTAAIAVDGRNGAGALLAELRKGYPKTAIAVPSARNVVDATAMAVDALRANELTHWSDEGQDALNESALTSISRPIGKDGGWAFGGEFSTPIEAMCLAYWINKTTKRKPGKGSRLL